MAKFEGIIPAIITPFTDEGHLYVSGMQEQLEYLAGYKIKNVFVCGSYGSFPLMTTEERKCVAKHVIDICEDLEMQTIIQVGSPSPKIAIELAKHAENMGADAISAVVPFYYSSTFYNESTFLKYYESLVKSVSIDVHCYNNANTTGFNVTPQMLKKLIDVGVLGIKDGGGSLLNMYEMIDVINKAELFSFDYYPSSTASLITGFLAGARACISGVCLSVPHLILAIYHRLMAENIHSAINLHKKAVKVRSILGAKTGRAIAAYDVLHARGVDVGTCRAPWERLSDEDREDMLIQLRELEVL